MISASPTALSPALIQPRLAVHQIRQNQLIRDAATRMVCFDWIGLVDYRPQTDAMFLFETQHGFIEVEPRQFFSRFV